MVGGDGTYLGPRSSAGSCTAGEEAPGSRTGWARRAAAAVVPRRLILEEVGPAEESHREQRTRPYRRRPGRGRVPPPTGGTPRSSS